MPGRLSLMMLTVGFCQSRACSIVPRFPTNSSNVSLAPWHRDRRLRLQWFLFFPGSHVEWSWPIHLIPILYLNTHANQKTNQSGQQSCCVDSEWSWQSRIQAFWATWTATFPPAVAASSGVAPTIFAEPSAAWAAAASTSGGLRLWTCAL